MQVQWVLATPYIRQLGGWYWAWILRSQHLRRCRIGGRGENNLGKQVGLEQNDGDAVRTYNQLQQG